MKNMMEKCNNFVTNTKVDEKGSQNRSMKKRWGGFFLIKYLKITISLVTIIDKLQCPIHSKC